MTLKQLMQVLGEVAIVVGAGLVFGLIVVVCIWLKNDLIWAY
jgi:hypothetical protein